MTDSLSKRSKLFEDFPAHSREQWEKMAEDAWGKGNFREKFTWKTFDNISVQPYYDQEEWKTISSSLPGEYPYLRGSHSGEKKLAWSISQNFFVEDPLLTNKMMHKGISGGLDEVGFVFSPGFSWENFSAESFSSLWEKMEEKILDDSFSLSLSAGSASSWVMANLVVWAQEKNVPLHKIFGSIDNDLVHTLSCQGEVHGKDPFDSCYRLFHFIQSHLPGFFGLTISSSSWHQAGATLAQELAFTLAAAVEYFDQFTEKGLSPAEINSSCLFSFSIGTNFFFEIAKLRAARFLWGQIYTKFDPDGAGKAQMKIRSQSSLWNKTVCDPYTNLLRTTTETMAAVIGGSNYITTSSHNQDKEENDPDAQRLARNIQNLIKEESNLHRSLDPAGGSYYLENLTQQFVEESWKIFQDVEKEGGLLKALQSGFIQKEIATSLKYRKKLLRTRKEILLGTNLYSIAEKEKILSLGQKSKKKTSVVVFPEVDFSSLEGLAEQVLSKAPRWDLEEKASLVVSPLESCRGAEVFEKLRETQQSKKVCLLLLDKEDTTKQRLAFAQDFLACGGITPIIVEEEAEMKNLDKYSAVAFCGSDISYEEKISLLVSDIKRDFPSLKIFVVGRYSGDNTDISGLIFQGADVVEVISGI